MDTLSLSLGLAVAITLLAMEHAPARADEGSAGQLDGSYFGDGGAIAFIYAPLLVTAGLGLALEPPLQPRLFAPDEGGAPYRGDSVPYSAVLGGNVLAGAGMLAIPAQARWHHVKGFAQTLSTTGMLVSAAKLVLGRRRPDYDSGDSRTSSADGRRSFFSGHASFTLTATTYLGLYLRQHLFAPLRPAGSVLPWWEAASYAGLLAVSVYVPWSRVDDHRHHRSDVLTGAVVGGSMAAVFFWWQERRFRAARGSDMDGRMAVVPTGWPAGVALQGWF